MNASAAGNVVAVNSGGTYSVGSATQTMAGGLTVTNGGTLALPTASGVVAIGSGKTVTMDGTLNASSTTATIQSVSGTYGFNIGSTSTSAPVLNITGLKVRDTTANGMYINSNGSAAVTTFTRFDNIAFSNGAGTGDGNYNLRIYAPSQVLTSQGCTFDTTIPATVAANVYLQGSGARALFGGALCPDTSGSIEGFPTAAFDWSNFTYYASYAAYHDTGGGTADTVYVRTNTGAASYSWSTSSGEDIIGTPRWDTVSSVHYVYVATTGGKVYRLIDNGSTLTPDTVSPWNGANNPFDCSCTITTPLAQDTATLYWCCSRPTSSTDPGGAAGPADHDNTHSRVSRFTAYPCRP